jgi:hypothetical protein
VFILPDTEHTAVSVREPNSTKPLMSTTSSLLALAGGCPTPANSAHPADLGVNADAGAQEQPIPFGMHSPESYPPTSRNDGQPLQALLGVSVSSSNCASQDPLLESP